MRADVNDEDALVKLAEYYYFGNTKKHVGKDQNKAFEYFTKAAEMGSIRAKASLSVMLLNGIGNEPNYELALEYAEIGARELDRVDCYNVLGFMYYSGTGVEKNESLAVEMFEKSAQLGNEEALSNLGIIYYSGSQDTPRNLTKAIQYNQKAMLLGHPNAALVMSNIFNENKGEIGVSCQSIFVAMMNSLVLKSEYAESLRNGYKFYVAQNYERSMMNYAWASMLGLSGAQVSMEFLFKTGRTGTLKCKLGDNRICGAIYSYMSAIRGSMTGDKLSRIADLFFDGAQETLRPDMAYAYYFYEMDMRKFGSEYSAFSLAYMNEKGLGSQKNTSRAISLYNELIQGGFQGRYSMGSMVAASLAKFNLVIKETVSELAGKYF